MIAFLVLSLYSIPLISCLDSETNERMFKFTTISGAPSSLNGSSQESLSDYSECIQKCLDDEECVLVHQEFPDAPCFFFPWGSVGGVRNNASGGEGVTSFKVFTDQPACDLNALYLLNGQTYAIFPNDTEKYLWRIDTSEDGWTITYLPCQSGIDTKCGNWGSLRPYPDSCDNECKLTMIQVYAEPGNIKRSTWNTSTEETWMDCMIRCYSDFECSMAHYLENEKKCDIYTYGALNILTKTEAESGSRMALKAPLSNVTCKWSTEQLLADTYFLPYGRIAKLLVREFFRIQTFPKLYLVMYYRDEEANYATDRRPQCPTNFIGIGTLSTVCEQPFRSTNISQREAKEICEMMGGHLFVEINNNMTTRLRGGRIFFNLIADGRIWEMGDVTDQRFWVGLEKVDDCSTTKNQSLCTEYNNWVWSEPGWISLASSPAFNGGPAYNDTKQPMTWGPGEPSSDPNKTCAYMQMGEEMFDMFKTTDISNGRSYNFVAADCNSRDVDGFICGAYTQPVNNVRKYADVAAEYGVEERCCSYGTRRIYFMTRNWPEDFVPMYPNQTTPAKDEL